MRKYTFEPKPCITDQAGNTVRPFHIDGQEIFQMNIQVMLGMDKDMANQEMVRLCEAIKEHTGAILSVGELPEIINKREILVEEDEKESD